MAGPSEGDTVKPTDTNKSTTNGINIPASGEGARKRRRLESLTTNSEIPEKTQRRDEPCNVETLSVEHAENRRNLPLTRARRKQDQASPVRSQEATTRRTCDTRRDETVRLRKTIQWLEEGARRSREDLANVRTELHEERRAAKIAKREFETALKEARFAEATKYQSIIAELKTRISYIASSPPSPSRLPLTSSFKPDPVKDENHKRELSTLRKRLADAENTIRRLEWQSLRSQANTTRSTNGTLYSEVRRMETEVRSLRSDNEKLEEKLRIALDVEKARIVEIRVQRENHEAELTALRKSLRGETIKMMDELRSKKREIERLSKLLKRRKLSPIEHDTMRKLQENKRDRPIQSASQIEKKIFTDDHAVESYVREVESDRTINEIEVERLRELALEQQEVIELLRQAVKERERKLEQLLNKKRKEEFYKQWLELEPVAEVDDEEDHEENDSALSSAPSSMSPQPGGCGQWQGNSVTREAYEAVLVEMEELQSKLFKEQRELSHAKVQVCDLEKALSQEKCHEKEQCREKELNELNEKLRATEEREATLLVELFELREQNELLEFRLLELEETPTRKDSPDYSMDSGVVSPELTHKDHLNKQRSRAIATVIPYTNNVTKCTSPVLPRKPPLSLQESGIFEEDDDEESEEIEHSSRGTQTEVPSGELLQEVQRLQELRVRIQERAAKATTPVFQSIDPSKICHLDVCPTMDSIVQLTSYQERIRELEERLEIYEEAEECQEREKLLTKQREEELLDENYKLTERLYWLENEMRNVMMSNLSKDNDKSKYDEAIVMPRKEDTKEQTKNEISEASKNRKDTLDNKHNVTTCTRIVQTIGTCVNNMIVECSRCQGQANVEKYDEGTQSSINLVPLEKTEKKDEVEFHKPKEPIAINNTEAVPEKKVIYFRWR